MTNLNEQYVNMSVYGYKGGHVSFIQWWRKYAEPK